jgi:hypothetical protein
VWGSIAAKEFFASNYYGQFVKLSIIGNYVAGLIIECQK